MKAWDELSRMRRAIFLIDDPLAPWYWPPLPAGRRPRALEWARRARLVHVARNRLVCTMVRRIHRLTGFDRHPVPPPHPPRCVPGNECCNAIGRHRRVIAFICGVDEKIPQRFFIV